MSERPPREKAPRRPERILVRGTNWIGDAVMSTPALQRLRESFPSSQIVLMATPLTGELFATSPWVDRFLPYRRREEGWRAFARMVAQLRAERFDLAILFQNALEAALLVWLAGIPQRIGYEAEGRGWLLTTGLPRGPRHRHQIYDYLDLISASESVFGQTSSAAGQEMEFPHLGVREEARHEADRLLQGHGIKPGSTSLIALNVGATNSRAKCWPAEYYARLADWLATTYGAIIVLIGGPGERALAETVASRVDRRTHVVRLAGETTLPALLGVLEACALVVSNDTGPAHIAAALGRPVLTLFGPTNEWETAPRGARASLLRAEGIDCARCMHRDCPIDHRCMTRLTVEKVQEEVARLLQEAGENR